MHEQIMRVFGRLLPGTMICGSCTLKSVAKRGLHMSPSLYQFGLLNDSRFALNTEWDKRHQILNDELSISGEYEWISAVQKKFSGGGIASAVDVDIAVTLVRDPDQIDNIIELIYKLRHTSNAADLFSSTEYAIFRLLLRSERISDVFKLINDPINYGVYMNEHVASLFIDHFLQTKNIQGSAKIAIVLMQQEMFSNNFLNFLSVFSLLKWIEEPTEEFPYTRIFDPNVHTMTPPNPDLSSDDVVIFRIPFLKNKFDDQHFDLDEPYSLVGKSLEWFEFSHNLNLPKNDKSHILIQNVAFLGQVLQKKIPECQKFLCDGNKMLLPSTVALSKLFMDKLITDTDTASNDKNVFADFLTLLNSSTGDAKSDPGILSEILKTLYQPIFGSEKNSLADIQNKLFTEWNQYRKTCVQNQIEKFNLNNRLKAIAIRRDELLKEKDKLYFFENRTRWEDEADQKDKLWDELNLVKKEGVKTEEEYGRDIFTLTREGRVKKPSNTANRSKK